MIKIIKNAVKLGRIICLILILLLGNPTDTLAGPLTDRLAQYPQWKSKPSIQRTEGDLIYPDWMAGTWNVSCTLVDQVSPLAPEIITPGFEGNRRYLNQPVKFLVRFLGKYPIIPWKLTVSFLTKPSFPVVADRAFNGLKIAQAYLGEKAVLSVKVDAANPNRQITFLGGERQLISTVTKRGRESPVPNQFITTELTQQIFRAKSQIYFNEVETTTAYQLLELGNVEAEQITAIYLSPQDPNYFKAGSQPVALYHYQLLLSPLKDKKLNSI